MSAQLKPKYSLEEYLELDRTSEARLEWRSGEIFDTSVISKEHARIERNILTRLTLRLTGSGYEVFPANMRLRVPSLPPYRYADLSGLCGAALFEEIDGVDVLINPSLIVEVLSASTEAFERGDKFTHYQSIPGFSEYLLVAQHRPHVSQFIRQADGSWSYHEYNEPDAVVRLESLECELPLSELYRAITFGEAGSIPGLRPIE